MRNRAAQIGGGGFYSWDQLITSTSTDSTQPSVALNSYYGSITTTTPAWFHFANGPWSAGIQVPSSTIGASGNIPGVPLYITLGTQPAGADYTLTVYGQPTDWTPSTLCYNNQPSYGDTLYSATILASTHNSLQQLLVDLTVFTRPYYGLAVISSAPSGPIQMIFNTTFLKLVS